MELGTNDVRMNASTASVDMLIDRAVTDVQAVPCVVFVNVGVLAGPTGLADHFNERLQQDVAVHPNEHDHDWSSLFRQHPDWAADDVHLQTPYWSAYARSIIDAVHHFCG